MRIRTHRLMVFFCLISGLPIGQSVSIAESVPPLINYQGKLVSSNSLPVSSGDYELRFRIWDAPTGGTLVWGPQVFNGQSGPGYGAKVPVVQGWFNVILGPSDTNGTSIVNAFSTGNRFMEIQLGSGTPFGPRQQVLSTPYALTAGNLVPGVAAANLAASGQVGVASGGFVLSAANNPALESAGYARVGATALNDAWFDHRTNSLLGGRIGHSAVWTGSEMIVWGGINSGGSLLSNGARYNPVSNTWAAISTVGAPTARRAHTAVWTGREMIVWGGADANYLLDGGRYNPVGDTWLPLVGTSARSGHSAVWTGSEMIVWGGDYNGELNDGLRYNPTSNTWTAITGIGPPIARHYHSAVWTGNEMIVWGGYSGGGNVLNDGWRYDPGANVWNQVTANNLATKRSNHTAVWTGTEMIIWGGGTSTDEGLSDGWRYNPNANSWLAVATGMSGSRLLHSAVWTGGEMVVWGGKAANTNNLSLSDTWSYTPGKVMFLYQKP